MTTTIIIIMMTIINAIDVLMRLTTAEKQITGSYFNKDTIQSKAMSKYKKIK